MNLKNNINILINNIENSLKLYLKQSSHLKQLYLWLRNKYSKKHLYPNWNEILKKSDIFDTALHSLNPNENILIATSTGGQLPASILESSLAVALLFREVNVHVLLCDSFLPACLMCEIGICPNVRYFAYNDTKRFFCKDCYEPAYSMYKSIGIKVHKYSDLINSEDLKRANEISKNIPMADIDQYLFDGAAVGEHAIAGALRFFARGSLDGEPYAEPILRNYLNASLLTAFVIKNLFKKIRFECTVFHHGIYVPHGIIGEIARQQKVRVVNWNVGYRKGTFIFSHNDTYHHTMMSEPIEKWENIEWNTQIEKKVINYIAKRSKGIPDWHMFLKQPIEDLESLKNMGTDFSKPCIGLLTNVIWDAQLHYPANAFSNILDWIMDTIKYFTKRPELQLIIRVHPAEITGYVPSRQRVVDEIKKVFPVLPKNIFVIPPQSHISTYSVMQRCNAVIIYGTKTGVELTSMGIPVIVAGEAWIRNKGVTIDVKSKEEYFKILDQLPLFEPMSDDLIQRARKYAYHFFFRRMIPLPQMKPTDGRIPYHLDISNIKDLLPGRTIGFDILCNGILTGSDFIYPDELYVNINNE